MTTRYDNPNAPRFKYRYGFTQSGPAPAPELPEGKRLSRTVNGHAVTYVMEPSGNVRAFVGGVEAELSTRARDLLLLGWPDA